MLRRTVGLVLVLLSSWAAGSAAAQSPDSVPAAPTDSILPDSVRPDSVPLDDGPPLRGLTLADLRGEPARFEGRRVLWRGQFLSVERADSLRSDLRPGETYLLAREANGEPGYAYVVFPAALREAVRRLVPLERVEIVGRVRTGRAPLMGYPVLDLERIDPVRAGASPGTAVPRRTPYPLEKP